MSNKLYIVSKENDGITRGRIKVAGDVNIDISTARPLAEATSPSNIVYWLECAKMQIIASTGDYDDTLDGEDGK